MLLQPQRRSSYLDHDQLVDFLTDTQCPDEIIKKVKDVPFCNEWLLLYSKVRALMKDLKMSESQISALKSFINSVPQTTPPQPQHISFVQLQEAPTCDVAADSNNINTNCSVVGQRKETPPPFQVSGSPQRLSPPPRKVGFDEQQAVELIISTPLSSTTTLSSQQTMMNIQKLNTSQNGLITFDYKYKYLETLGNGHYGRVVKVKRKEKPTVTRAVKLIRESSSNDFNVNDALREVLQTIKAAHEHVVKIHEANIIQHDDGTKTLMIEMDCLELGNLNDFFIIKDRKPSEKIVISIIKQILSVLEHMKAKFGMVHRDIKPENILIRGIDLSNDTIDVCLADFGFAKSFGDSSSYASICGTANYMAPEIPQYENDETIEIQPFSTASDIYAFGATLFRLMTGFIFTRDTQTELTTSDSQYSTNLIEIVTKHMLSEDVKQRELKLIKTKLTEGREQSLEKAFEWCQKAAENGHAESQCSLGTMYYSGEGCEQSLEKAFEWYQKAANQGVYQAKNNLGVMYRKGFFVEQSYERAMYWFKQAWCGSAAYNIGMMYENGCEKSLDITAYNIGMMFENGEGCEISYEKAFKWYQKAAEMGFSEAQNSLGTMYHNGQGCEKSYEKAFEWYQKAADQGYADSQCRLGVMYIQGKGCEQSYEKAFEWYQRAANQGDTHSQFTLGAMYYYGHGCEQSNEKAIEWVKKAADKGYEQAQIFLTEFYRQKSGRNNNNTITTNPTTRRQDISYENVQRLMELGFSKQESETALIQANNDINLATELLLMD